MGKWEAKVCDVGGEKDFDFCREIYTSIAEIKGFRFPVRKDHSHTKESQTAAAHPAASRRGMRGAAA